MKYIARNIGPLSIIALCGCIGYLLGSVMNGVVAAIIIIATATVYATRLP